MRFLVICLVYFSLTCSPSLQNEVEGNKKVVFDFSTVTSMDGWKESSDTVREVGMSAATFYLQKTQLFQRAIFFTLLNPQPNGAGFAGVNFASNWDLQNFENIEMKLRGQGQNYGYKVVLRHKGLNKEPHPTYEQFFEAPKQFDVVQLPFNKFDAYYRGRKLNSTEAEPLDVSKISSFGLQVYGGVYLPIKQSGASSLEVDWIHAVKS